MWEEDLWGDIVGRDAVGALWEGALRPLEILRMEAHPGASCHGLSVTSSRLPQASEGLAELRVAATWPGVSQGQVHTPVKWPQ